jgi:hypothetical protein
MVLIEGLCLSSSITLLPLHEDSYDTHHDFFDRRLYSDPNTLNLIQNGRRNRMITVLWCVAGCACRGLVDWGGWMGGWKDGMDRVTI